MPNLNLIKIEPPILTKKSKNNWLIIPVFGILLFILLYWIASLFYPGGSEFERSANGFSWMHNYWCELMNTHAHNGKINKARPLSIAAMAILAISLGIFWNNAPAHIGLKRLPEKIIQFAGILSMATIPFLYFGGHDLVINIACSFGVIAILGMLIGLYKAAQYVLLYIGIFCLILVGVNNFIYYTTWQLIYLPVIQKITFLVVLLWFCLVTVHLFKTAAR